MVSWATLPLSGQPQRTRVVKCGRNDCKGQTRLLRAHFYSISSITHTRYHAIEQIYGVPVRAFYFILTLDVIVALECPRRSHQSLKLARPRVRVQRRSTSSRASQSHRINQNGATSAFEMCFVPSTLGPGAKRVSNSA